ncbi:MAG: methyltransferase domain-containing protein [Ilumatobacteraceae bacterium]
MNEGHLRYLVSPQWREAIEHDLVPWTLQQTDLGPHLLEIGPGPGLTTDVLRQRTERVTAVELDADLARELAARLAGTNVDVVNADATDGALPADTYSSAACFTMLHHVPTTEQQDRLFAEVHRVLRPGGVLVGVDSLDTEVVRAGHVDDVFNPVDPDTLADRLRRAGFSAVTVERREHQVRFRATKCSPGAPLSR